MQSSQNQVHLPIAVLLAWLFLAAAAGADNGSIRIVCANSILADFARNVAGDLGTVEYVMPAGVCPAHYDSRPSDIGLVASADVIVQIGWEGWLGKLVESSGNTAVPKIKTAGLGEWNIPEGAKAHVDRIAQGLANAFPQYASVFEKNAEDYKHRIDEKAAELRAKVEQAGVNGSKVVCMKWQKEFVEWLGFEVVASYGPPEGLSVEQSLNVTNAAARTDVCMIVDNLQSGTEFGAKVASQTGVSHVILTNFPGAIPGTDTYLDMIEYNTQQLIDGAKTYQNKRGEISRLEDEVGRLRSERSVYQATTAIASLLAIFFAVLFVRSRS